MVPNKPGLEENEELEAGASVDETPQSEISMAADSATENDAQETPQAEAQDAGSVESVDAAEAPINETAGSVESTVEETDTAHAAEPSTSFCTNEGHAAEHSPA